jgi:hypothetical protein
MADKEYTLVEIIRDPGRGVYEVSELDRTGSVQRHRPAPRSYALLKSSGLFLTSPLS